MINENDSISVRTASHKMHKSMFHVVSVCIEFCIIYTLIGYRNQITSETSYCVPYLSIFRRPFETCLLYFVKLPVLGVHACTHMLHAYQ